jgi:hypothetical protein
MIDFFHSQGIKVMRYDAFSTNSVYLKLDYGLLYSVRISDHPGKRYLSYRFNAIYHYHGPRYVDSEWNWKREFYSLEPSDLNQLCLQIIRLRKRRISAYGYYVYQEKMIDSKIKNLNSKGFWQMAQDLG